MTDCFDEIGALAHEWNELDRLNHISRQELAAERDDRRRLEELRRTKSVRSLRRIEFKSTSAKRK